MTTRVLMITLLFVAAFSSTPTHARGDCEGLDVSGCFTLQANESDLDGVVLGHGLTLVALDPHNGDLALVAGPDGISDRDLLSSVRQDPRVIEFNKLGRVTLEEARLDSLAAGSNSILGALVLQGEHTGPDADFFATPVWDGYMSQPAATLIRLPETRSLDRPEAQGFGLVAIIDTGVDEEHPVLAGALEPGYDFILDQKGIASEWQSLQPEIRQGTKDSLRTSADQSFASILEGRGSAVHMGNSTKTIVDQSFASILEGAQLPEAFGHGTMVAGLVRLAAPGARILPLRVFDGHGNANPWHVVQAIYYATDQGANVINMSFSVDKQSIELMRAIKYAESHGVVCVSSAGNTGTTSKSWPAAFNEVLGVASTDLDGNLSSFTNHGPNLVSLAAPGEELVTTYPGGLYALAWGTSFSAGLVSGATTLLNEDDLVDLFVDYQAAEEIFAASSVEIVSTQQAGSGRLDALAAFTHGLSGN